jgi:hypothetical protein
MHHSTCLFHGPETAEHPPHQVCVTCGHIWESEQTLRHQAGVDTAATATLTDGRSVLAPHAYITQVVFCPLCAHVLREDS